MFNWRDYITQDTLDWLLEEDNPSVRYLTLVDTLHKSESDKEVIAARKDVMSKGSAAKILSHQNPDGSFLSQSMIKTYGEDGARSGYLPKYRATTWQAIFLAQMCADKNDGRIKRLCHFILDTNYSAEYGVLGFFRELKGSLYFVVIPCFVANMVWALSRLGFYQDRRIQDSIKWLLKYQRFDDGDFKTPREWPYRGNRDRCFSRHSCYIGCTQALKAMTVVPEADRDIEIDSFIQRAIDFILLHRIYRRSRGNYQPIRKEYELLVFPLGYYDDILQILDNLLFFGVKDLAIDETVNAILEKRNERGRWLLEKTIRSSAMYSGVEEKGEESKWVTSRALGVLRKHAGT